jgi:stage V sporulation protein SpoVS
MAKDSNRRALAQAVAEAERLAAEPIGEELMGQMLEALALALRGYALDDARIAGLAMIARASMTAAILRGVCSERGLDFERACATIRTARPSEVAGFYAAIGATEAVN